MLSMFNHYPTFQLFLALVLSMALTVADAPSVVATTFTAISAASSAFVTFTVMTATTPAPAVTVDIFSVKSFGKFLFGSLPD